jgi:hypothetical protein
MPILPLAPDLFSTTICWCRWRDKDSPTRRAPTSVDPPAGNGTMKRTGRLGHSCAAALVEKATTRTTELHRARPAGVEQHLISAELHARGLEGFSYNTPSLLTSVFLFDWDTGRQVWPPSRSSMASAFAAVAPPHDSHRLSANWAKDNERRAAAQRAENQRIADYYARTTKEQEDRENAEARERFLAQQQQLLVNRPPRP